MTNGYDELEIDYERFRNIQAPGAFFSSMGYLPLVSSDVFEDDAQEKCDYYSAQSQGEGTP